MKTIIICTLISGGLQQPDKLMNQRHTRSDSNQIFAKDWLKQAEAQLAGTPQKQRGASVKKKRHGGLLPLILGFVVLQGIMLIAALSVTMWTDTPQAETQDTRAALDVNWNVEPQPPLQEPPPPTPIAQNIVEPIVAPAVTEIIPPTANTRVKFRGVEITQGIQVFNEPENPRCQPDPTHPDNIFCNNSIPLVAGRHTLVRVYLACNQSCPTIDTVIQLNMIKDGQKQGSLVQHVPPEAFQRINPLALSELRMKLDNSINFEFFPPPAWMSGQVTFQIQATLNDSDIAPAQFTIASNFIERKPLRIAYLPIEYQGLRPPDPANVDHWLLRMYPVPNVEYYRLPMPDLVWEGNVGKSEVLRKLLYTYWFFAQYHPTESRPDQLFGWLPQELYNGGASDPFWCPDCAGPHSSRVAFGGLRPEQDIGGPRILVHEIAHNLGAQHAWSPTNQEDVGCFKAAGVDIQVDPEWPYAQTPYIQEVGIDLYSDPPLIQSPSVYDMMAYCTQPWVSPHTYRKIFDSPFLQPNSQDIFEFSNFQPQTEPTENGTLLVSGVVYPNGTISKPEVIKLEGDAFGRAAGFSPPLDLSPPPGDDYCLNVHGTGNSLLAQHCFDVGFGDLETGLPTDASPFFFTLPQVNVAEVEEISITKNQVAVIIVTPSNNSPEVTITYPNGGEVLSGYQTITWDASDADSDLLSYDVLYSPDGGQSWLPLAVRLTEPHYTFFTGQVLSGSNTLIRVIANDGFNTTVDQSDAPFTIEALPENSVSLVGPSVVQPGQTFEVDVVANQVTEPGLFGVQFEFNFDPAVVQVENIHPNAALDLVVDDTIDNNSGRVSFIASRKGYTSNLTGQITLATLTLTAQQIAQLQLELLVVDAGARGGIRVPISEIYGLSLTIVD